MRQTIRTALLQKVFSGDKKRRQFDAKLARVCVLFEDLRIEISGVTERRLPALDTLDPQKEYWISPEQTGKYRQFYFVRRSLATLRDFDEALRLVAENIRNDPELQLTFRRLPAEAPDAWNAAIQFFNTNHIFLQKVRNDIGGHFGHEAALSALSMFKSDTVGSITLASIVGNDKRQLKLHFAAEVAATALLKHLPNKDIAKFGEFLRTFLLPGYQDATNSVYILVHEYLWERFGS